MNRLINDLTRTISTQNDIIRELSGNANRNLKGSNSGRRYKNDPNIGRISRSVSVQDNQLTVIANLNHLKRSEVLETLCYNYLTQVSPENLLIMVENYELASKLDPSTINPYVNPELVFIYNTVGFSMGQVLNSVLLDFCKTNKVTIQSTMRAMVYNSYSSFSRY